jgi:LacI family transcriptional regulator
MPSTVSDVAKEAGVSVATVSRVFNDSDRVRPDTRERVLEAARRLDYVPNEAARSLVNDRTQTIGAILPEMHGEFFAEVIRSLDRTARERDHHLLVSSSHGNAAEVRAALGALRGRVDGLVVLWPHADLPSAVADADLPPTAFLNGPVPSEGDSAGPFPSRAAFTVDNRSGARDAVAHLIDHGHRRIATITGPPENADAQARLEGYREALRAGGAAVDAALEATGDFRRPAGRQRIAELLDRPQPPTALFAANDEMAIGAMHGLRRAGVSVPGDVAVVGFDDVPSAATLRPPLTTVRVPVGDLGRRAMGWLLDVLAGRSPGADPPVVLPTQLIRRRSCGCGLGAGA